MNSVTESQSEQQAVRKIELDPLKFRKLNSKEWIDRNEILTENLIKYEAISGSMTLVTVWMLVGRVR